MTTATAAFMSTAFANQAFEFNPFASRSFEPASYREASAMQRSQLSALAAPAANAANRTMRLIQLGVFAVSVAAAIPTAQNLYYSWKNDVPFNEVAHRLTQYDLWMKNLDCKIDYRTLSAASGTKVDVGTCAKSGDIAIKVSSTNGQANYEWIAFDQLPKPTTKAAGLMNLLISSALADELLKPQSTAPAADGKLRVAENGMETVCQAKVKDQIVRVVKDAGKCFKETVSPFKGSVEKREEVPCNTQCTPAG
jgi:hypothetical protein